MSFRCITSHVATDLMVCLVTFFFLIYDDLERHIFNDEHCGRHYICDVFSPFVIKVALTRAFCDGNIFVINMSQPCSL